MKSLMLSMSVLASATLATPLVAAENSNPGAAAPSAATVKVVSAVVGTYADRDGLASARDLVLYPTANREVVFVSFRTAGAGPQANHIALVSTQGGRVTRFTDFSGPQPRRLPTLAAAQRDDAQSQARALLVTAVPLSRPAPTTPAIDSRQVPASAQSQAADLLRSAPTDPREPRRMLARGVPAVHGDSQAMARALLTMSTGE